MVNRPRHPPTARRESSPARCRLSDVRLALGIGLFSALSVSGLGVMVIDLVAFLRHLDYAGL